MRSLKNNAIVNCITGTARSCGIDRLGFASQLLRRLYLSYRQALTGMRHVSSHLLHRCGTERSLKPVPVAKSQRPITGRPQTTQRLNQQRW